MSSTDSRTDTPFAIVPFWLLDVVSSKGVLTYIGIAGYADASGDCNPSVVGIAKKCGLSERSVREAIEELQQAQALEVKHIAGKRSFYRVLRTDPCKICTPAKSAAKLDIEIVQKETDSTVSNLFNQFYTRYPRKKSRGDALKAYRAAVKTADPSVILAGLDLAVTEWNAKLRDDPKFEVKHIPYPATWLRAEGWADEHETTSVLPDEW